MEEIGGEHRRRLGPRELPLHLLSQLVARCNLFEPVRGLIATTLPDVVTAPDVPGYRIAGVLGKGRFATVYRDLQLTVGREVAVR